MDFWMSGEIDADVGELFRGSRGEIQKLLGATLKTRSYASLNELTFVAIIRAWNDDDYSEVVRFSKRKGDAELRLFLDHGAFLRADSSRRRAMLCGVLLKGVSLLCGKGVPPSDTSDLDADIKTAAIGQGWTI